VQQTKTLQSLESNGRKSLRCRLEPEMEQINTSKRAKEKGEHEWIILHEKKRKVAGVCRCD
jgi:hypothetical protein